MNLNLNATQLLAITIAILGVLTASAANLTDLVGPGATKIIVSLSTLLMSILSSVVGILTGQSSSLKYVQAMPGVEKIIVNAKANETLAGLAVDPAQTKIEALPAAEAAVNKTAIGAGAGS